MHLADRWHMVHGTWEETDTCLSDPLDCCTFALELGDRSVLFDTGAGRDPAVTLAAIESARIPPVSHIVLTHAHADHAGGAAHLADATGAEVLAGTMSAAWISVGDVQRISLDRAQKAGVYPLDYVFTPCPVRRPLDDGARFRVGAAEITPIATPGHSADHTSYLVVVDGQSSLVGGDALFCEGTVVLQDTWDSDVAATCATVRRLSRETFDRLLPGHGPPVLNDAGAHVARAAERVSRLLPPRLFM